MCLIFSCRFCIQLRNVLTDSVALPVTTILVIHANTKIHFICTLCACGLSVSYIFQRTVDKSNQPVVLSLISTLSYLARDDVIRHKLAHEPECLKASLVAIVSVITHFSLSLEKCKLLLIVLTSYAKKNYIYSL